MRETKFLWKAKYIVLALVVAGAAVALYKSPDENFYEPSEDEVIRQGQRVALRVSF